MFISKENLVAFAAGAATFSLCSWAYMKYRHAFISEKIRHAGSQTTEMKLKDSSNQTEMSNKVNIAIMAMPSMKSASTSTLNTYDKYAEIGIQTCKKVYIDASTSTTREDTSTSNINIDNDTLSSASSIDDVYYLCQQELPIEASLKRCLEPNIDTGIAMRSEIAVDDTMGKEPNVEISIRPIKMATR